MDRIHGIKRDYSELIIRSKGTVQKKWITKPIHQFDDEKLRKGLSAVKSALGELRAAFNERVNSGEIRPAHEIACFNDRATVEKMKSRGKSGVIEGAKYSAVRIGMLALSLSPGSFHLTATRASSQ